MDTVNTFCYFPQQKSMEISLFLPLGTYTYIYMHVCTKAHNMRPWFIVASSITNPVNHYYCT